MLVTANNSLPYPRVPKTEPGQLVVDSHEVIGVAPFWSWSSECRAQNGPPPALIDGRREIATISWNRQRYWKCTQEARRNGLKRTRFFSEISTNSTQLSVSCGLSIRWSQPGDIIVMKGRRIRRAQSGKPFWAILIAVAISLRLGYFPVNSDLQVALHASFDQSSWNWRSWRI